MHASNVRRQLHKKSEVPRYEASAATSGVGWDFKTEKFPFAAASRELIS